MEKKSLKLNFAMNMILNVVSVLYPLITFPYVSRVLGTVGTGKVSFATAFVSYFITFASLGIPTYGVKVVAQNRENGEKCSKVVHELLIINLITTSIAYLVFAVCMFTVPKLAEDKPLYLITCLSVFLNALGMEWLYRGFEEYVYITKRTLAFKLIALVGMFVLVRQSSDYYWYALLTVAASYGSYVLNIIHSRKYIDYKYHGPYNLTVHLKAIFYLLGASFVTSLYSHLDSTMIGFMLGDSENGLYYATNRIRNLFVMCTSALTTVMIPRMAYYIGKKDLKKSEYYIKKSIQAVGLIAVPLLIYCMIMAQECLVFFAGSEYAGVADTLRIQMMSGILVSFSSIWGNQVLIPSSGENKYFISVLSGAVVNCICNYLLIARIGIVGAAVATLMTEIVVFCMLRKFSVKYVQVKRTWTKVTPYVFSSIPAGIVTVLIRTIVDQYNLFIQLCITAVVFFGIYGVMLLVGMKDELLVELLNQLNVKFKEKKDV